MFLSTLSPSVPSVPQGVSALSTGSTTVMVTWMEPVVSFREHTQLQHCVCMYTMVHIAPFTIILSALVTFTKFSDFP